MRSDIEKAGNTKALSNLSTQLSTLKNEAKAADQVGKSFKSLFIDNAKKFSEWLIAGNAMMQLYRAARYGLSTIYELDKALTNINYTMTLMPNKLNEVGDSSMEMAMKLKTSARNILEAVTLYANVKESADSILTKSMPAIMLANVSGISGSESAKTLQAIMNQFDMTENDLMEISDVIQTVSQNMAYDFGAGIKEIAAGIQASGSVAKSAGLDLKEYASLLGLAIEKTGQSGSTIGNAYKTIFSRITAASKTEGTLKDDISNAEKSLRAVGIQVRDSEKEFRDLTDILSDLGKVWDSLSSVQQSNISYNVAGIRQTNILKSLLGYWSDYETLVTKANDSTGVAFENQEKYAKSLQGRLGELKAVGETTWNNILNSDELKALVIGFTNIIRIVEKATSLIGGFGTAIAGIGIYKFVKNLDWLKSRATLNLA